MTHKKLSSRGCLIAAITCWSFFSFSTAIAQEGQNPINSIDRLSSHVDWFWTVLAAILVFFMQAGFALLESGLVRSKNLINIMMKNIADLSIGTLSFWAIGFGIMFSGASFEFFPNPDVNSFGKDANWMYAFILFQAVFAATAATIVSGAVAERAKFTSYLIISFIITAFIYPFSGSWAWGSLWNGEVWLEKIGFVDFAGSTVVHSVGGWAALAAAFLVGPRVGKFNEDGTSNAIPGHNMGFATLGMIILWFGWFGFNAGSTTSMDGGSFARVALVTTLSAASGCLTSMFLNWKLFKYPDISMTINGALGGLVSITAGCYTMTPVGAIIAGAIGGFLVVLSVLLIEKLKIDDPVGAISVHGTCGVWGTLACAIPFLCRPGEAASFTAQITGVAAIGAFAFFSTFILLLVVKKTIGLRVTQEEELEGLDFFEHGGAAYLFDTKN